MVFVVVLGSDEVLFAESSQIVVRRTSKRAIVSVAGATHDVPAPCVGMFETWIEAMNWATGVGVPKRAASESTYYIFGLDEIHPTIHGEFPSRPSVGGGVIEGVGEDLSYLDD